jgi:hypothetical protein
MKRKTFKQRKAIARKAKATKAKNIKNRIAYLVDLNTKNHRRMCWIAEGLHSKIEAYENEVMKELECYLPGKLMVNDILPYFNRQLRANIFGASVRYSLQWWLEERGFAPKSQSIDEVMKEAFKTS